MPLKVSSLPIGSWTGTALHFREHKKRLIEQRRWADRNDQVDPLTVEWMRELGYEVGQPREPQRPAPQAE